MQMTVNRVQMFICAWLFTVSRMIDCPEIERIVDPLIDQRSDWCDLTFATDAPQHGLTVNQAVNQAVYESNANSQKSWLPIDLLTDELVKVLNERKLIDQSITQSTKESSTQSTYQSISQSINQVFEPFNLAFLAPAKLTDEEREQSWAPSNHSRNRSINASIDDSLTRLESPFMSPKITQANQPMSPIRSSEEEMKVVSPIIQSSNEQTVTQSIDDSSFLSVASMCNRNSTRFEKQFRQSMRILVDDTLNQATNQTINPSINHSISRSENGENDQSTAPSVERRNSLSSSRRRSTADLTPSTSAPSQSLSDQFIAVPSVAAPPTLNVQAAIRQQIESSYAVSPSHAVSGSVNIVDDQTTSQLTSQANSQLTTPQRSGRRVSTSSRSSRDGEAFSSTHQLIHTLSNPATQFDADSIVYGLSEDGDGFAHLEGTGENILKFQFPKLNTFDSYLPAELDG